MKRRSAIFLPTTKRITGWRSIWPENWLWNEKDVEKAEKHLTALAELDFGYKDVSTLLEDVARCREEGGGE